MIVNWSNTLIRSGFVLMIAFSTGTQAEKSHQKKWEESLGQQMTVKCYIEYLGGGYDIRFVIGGFKKANEAIAILNTSKATKNTDKKITKINECVKVNEKFQSAQANHLFEQTPR